MGVIGTLFTFWAVSSLVSVSWVAYKMIWPSLCSHPYESALYKRRCYEPLLVPHEMVDFKLYVGVSDQPPSLPIWTKLNARMNETIAAPILVPIPPEVRLDDAELNAWLSISKTVPSSSEPLSEEEQRVVASSRIIHHVTLTAMKVPRANQRRNLLDDSNSNSKNSRVEGTTTMTTAAAAGGREEQQQHQQREAPHWKYGTYPLIVRLVHFDGVTLASRFLDVIGYRLHTRSLPPAAGDGGTVMHTRREQQLHNYHNYQSMYEPAVFVDDTSLLRHHHVEIARNLSRPPTEMQFRFEPTTPLVFSFKVTMQQILGVVGQLHVRLFYLIHYLIYWPSLLRIDWLYLVSAFTQTDDSLLACLLACHATPTL
jgi:hypothetical protein